jgi:hypothetical protein
MDEAFKMGKNMFGGIAKDVFGGDPETAENQEVEHQSGASRLANSMLLACMSPCFILICLFVLGWNEKRAVCSAKAIVAGKDKVVELGCTESHKSSGELVMFSCNLERPSQTYSIGGSSAFASTTYSGYCLKSDSEMYQCVEHVSSKTKKDSVGGGTTTVKTYTYSKEWKSSHVDSSSFSSTGKSSSAFDTCSTSSSFQNPSWPSDVPEAASTTYGQTAKIGNFTIQQSFIRDIPCATAISVSPLPSGWVQKGTSYQRGSDNVIGSVRLSYKTNSFASSDTMYTVLGKNENGVITDWTAPASWLCSGYSLGNIDSGSLSKDELFKTLEAENTGTTWLLRVLFFFLLWASCSCLLGPLEVAADCIPCIGPFLGDLVEAVICMVSCPPACCCCIGVCAIVWVAMRPVIGGLCLTMFVCFFCIFGGLTAYSKDKKRKSRMGGEDSGLKAGAVGNPTDKE